MGLFDALKKGLDSLDTDQLKKMVSDVVGDVRSQQSVHPAAEPADYEPSRYEAPKRDNSITDAQFAAKMDAIIEKNFKWAQYEKNVAASTLMPSCHPACTPIQYLFYREGKPVLAVVLVRQNNYRGMNVKGTRHICEAAGIRYMRFFGEMKNEEAYVANRINEALHS